MSSEPRNTAVEPGKNFEDAARVREMEQSQLPSGQLDVVGEGFALAVCLHGNRITSNSASR